MSRRNSRSTFSNFFSMVWVSILGLAFLLAVIGMSIYYHSIAPLFVFLLGLAIGSFMNVLIYRISHNENLKEIFYGRSYCPYCKRTIKWYDNIPVLSFLFLKGKCRYCGNPISLRYPLVELLGGLYGVIAWLISLKGGIILGLSLFIFFCLLTLISFIDWYTFEIPDILSIGGTILGLILAFFRPDISFSTALLSALVGFLFPIVISWIYYLLRGFFPMGIGDAKLLAMIGAFGGWITLYFSIFLGSVLALIYAFPKILKSKSLKFVIPFAPFLSMGAMIGFLIGIFF